MVSPNLANLLMKFHFIKMLVSGLLQISYFVKSELKKVMKK